jgi:hypothetical protein
MAQRTRGELLHIYNTSGFLSLACRLFFPPIRVSKTTAIVDGRLNVCEEGRLTFVEMFTRHACTPGTARHTYPGVLREGKCATNAHRPDGFRECGASVARSERSERRSNPRVAGRLLRAGSRSIQPLHENTAFVTDQLLESPRHLHYPIINFGRYCNASAKCTDWIASLPARSAMVRDNFKMR